MRLIDGLTSDLNISVSNRFSDENYRSIDVTVVCERKFSKWLAVTNDGRTTIDRVRYRGLVRGRFPDRPSPVVWMGPSNH